jgi:enoyl-CoA hydratase/carnithine racemase
VEEKRIIRSDEGGLCTLSLDRTSKLNALDTQTFEELDAHLAEIEAATHSIGCVVLRANGRAFCAGADLGGIGEGFTDSRFKPGVIERLACLPQPVIAAVHGVCFTGGLELALAADLILADASARFADTHGKWGLVGAWGMTQRLPRKVGKSAALQMMLTSREVSAQEAKEIGLVDMLGDEGGLDAMVAELAGAILANSWHTNLATKRLIKETDGMSLADGLSHEHYRYPGFAPDYKDRIASFGKKK